MCQKWRGGSSPLIRTKKSTLSKNFHQVPISCALGGISRAPLWTAGAHHFRKEESHVDRVETFTDLPGKSVRRDDLICDVECAGEARISWNRLPALNISASTRPQGSCLNGTGTFECS
jgi:hypothetical protein